MSTTLEREETTDQTIEHFDVVIVGAGISGIGTAYHLQNQNPGRSFVMLEAQDSFGGTWHTHRYPGIRSDSDLYTFGYRFKPWTSAPIATAAEIQGDAERRNDEQRVGSRIEVGDRRDQDSGRTGQNEVVLVVYDPKKISYDSLLKTFWESHNPTQGMRQGNDVGTQYRSGIYTFTPAQRKAAEASKAMYGPELAKKGYGAITTEIADAGPFYFAEDYHQQYLAKNPFGYCGLGGTGVSCPIGTGAKLAQGASA